MECDAVWTYTNAPACFQRAITKVLQGIKGVQVYLDDIIIYSMTEEEQLIIIEKVFKRLKQYNLKMKSSKCSFFKRQIRYLGMIIGPHGIGARPEHVKEIVEFAVPKNQLMLKRYLGMIQWISMFLPQIASW